MRTRAVGRTRAQRLDGPEAVAPRIRIRLSRAHPSAPCSRPAGRRTSGRESRASPTRPGWSLVGGHARRAPVTSPASSRRGRRSTIQECGDPVGEPVQVSRPAPAEAAYAVATLAVATASEHAARRTRPGALAAGATRAATSELAVLEHVERPAAGSAPQRLHQRHHSPRAADPVGRVISPVGETGEQSGAEAASRAGWPRRPSRHDRQGAVRLGGEQLVGEGSRAGRPSPRRAPPSGELRRST